MGEKFEDFIRQHRNEFEVPGPSPRVWEALEKQLPRQESGKVIPFLRRHWLKVAAVALLIINAAVFYQYQQLKTQQGLATIAPEIEEANLYYTSQITSRLDAIRAYPEAEAGLDSITRQELQLRNDTYKMLERELKNNPGNERIRAAMIRYYQLKLDLLDKILGDIRNRQATTKKSTDYEAEI